MAKLSRRVAKTGCAAEYNTDCSGCVHMQYPCLYAKARLHGVIVCLAWGWLGKSERKRQMSRKVSHKDTHFCNIYRWELFKSLSDSPMNADLL